MISLVIPVYNEDKLIDTLCEKSIRALSSITHEFEIIFVNDGSTDATLQKLINLQNKDRRVKILSLSRNYGHQAAYTAGLHHAKGDYIAMMDGDLQDPPELIAEMYNKLINESYDVILGRRANVNQKIHKRLFTKLFHLVFNKIATIKFPANVGNFSIFNKKVLSALLQLKEKNRYLPGLRYFVGFHQGYIDYKRDERDLGETKMGFIQLTKLAFDAIFSFSKLPIRISLIIGTIGILLSLSGALIVIYKKFSGVAITGWTSTMLSLFFFGSVQLFFLGVLGEYIYRIYKETQNRPIYIIDRFYE